MNSVKKSHHNSSKMFYALSLAFQLGFLIAIPIAGFMFLGDLGDKFLKTRPFFLILGMTIGVIITAYEMYNMLIALIKNND